jgi:hypothetical protein
MILAERGFEINPRERQMSGFGRVYRTLEPVSSGPMERREAQAIPAFGVVRTFFGSGNF